MKLCIYLSSLSTLEFCVVRMCSYELCLNVSYIIGPTLTVLALLSVCIWLLLLVSEVVLILSQSVLVLWYVSPNHFENVLHMQMCM